MEQVLMVGRPRISTLEEALETAIWGRETFILKLRLHSKPAVVLQIPRCQKKTLSPGDADDFPQAPTAVADASAF